MRGAEVTAVADHNRRRTCGGVAWRPGSGVVSAVGARVAGEEGDGDTGGDGRPAYSRQRSTGDFLSGVCWSEPCVFWPALPPPRPPRESMPEGCRPGGLQRATSVKEGWHRVAVASSRLGMHEP